MISRRTVIAAPPAMLLAGSAAGAPAGTLRWDSHYLFLRVAVNGRPLEALIDFNVHMTLIDRRQAASIGAGGAAGLMVEAAGIRLGPIKAAAIDLADYANQRLRGRIGMVLGRDLFAATPWRLDLAALSLERVDREGVQAGTRLTIGDRFGYATIPVRINGIAAQAALSFNDMERMRVGAGYAARIGLARPRGSAAVQGLAATVAGVGVDRLELAAMRIDNIAAGLEAGDHAPDAWLGPDILRRFRIGIDLAGGALWFAPA